MEFQQAVGSWQKTRDKGRRPEDRVKNVDLRLQILEGMEQGARSQNSEEKQLKLSSSQLLATDYWLQDSLISDC